MFVSKMWQWEQFHSLLFRLYAPSPSTSVGFWQRSLDRMKAPINLCLGAARLLCFHHHGSCLGSLWLLRAQLFLPSYCGCPMFRFRAVFLPAAAPGFLTGNLQKRVFPSEQAPGASVPPLQASCPLTTQGCSPGVWNQYKNPLDRCISELSIRVLGVYSLNCPHFASHGTEGTDSIFICYNSGGCPAVLVWYWAIFHLHQQTD